MKKKSKKHVDSLELTEKCVPQEKCKKTNVEDVTKKLFLLSSSTNKSIENMAFEEAKEKKIHKKSKRKRNENAESNEKSLNNNTCNEKQFSPCKKQKQIMIMNAEQYKPGMLSDLLQTRKYGCLILPWEASFGNNRSKTPNETTIEKDGKEQQPKIKINPLFDMSKINEGNLSRSSVTHSVFVGNLPQEITVNQVKKIFKKYGSTISKIKIRTEERKKYNMFSKNNQNIIKNDQCKHAVVKFSSLKSYEAALKMNGKLYNEHHLRITGTKSETPASSDPGKSVFVGNLAVGISDDDLWKKFENCGEINSVRVIRDKLNKKGYFGYVNFKSAESVDDALELDGTSILGREIRVSRIKSNIDSLSNSITVKRKKRKRAKPQLNGIEPSNPVDTFGENHVKSRKSSKNKTVQDLERNREPGIPKKKKKKKKPPSDGTEGNKTSEIE